MSNSESRTVIKNARKALPYIFQKEAEEKIFARFIKLKLLCDKTHIGCYYAANGEVPTTQFQLHCWQHQQNYYLPILSPENGNSLQFAKYQQLTESTINQYNILEPINTPIINASQLDLVLVPLVAFDENCNRLGMGKGYYDRTFAFRKTAKTPLLIGLAYEIQKLSHIDVNNWDIPMDIIITETSIYTRKSLK